MAIQVEDRGRHSYMDPDLAYAWACREAWDHYMDVAREERRELTLGWQKSTHCWTGRSARQCHSPAPKGKRRGMSNSQGLVEGGGETDGTV